MSIKSILYYFSFFLIIISGCATTNSDPHSSGSFIEGLRGVYGGGYQQRIDQRQEELQKQRAMSNELESEMDSRECDYQLKKRQFDSEIQRKEELSKYLLFLSEDLNRLKAKNATQKKKLTDLKQKISQLQSDINKWTTMEEKSATDSENYKVLEKKRDLLAQEYKALLDYFDALSNIISQ